MILTHSDPRRGLQCPVLVIVKEVIRLHHTDLGGSYWYISGRETMYSGEHGELAVIRQTSA